MLESILCRELIQLYTVRARLVCNLFIEINVSLCLGNRFQRAKKKKSGLNKGKMLLENIKKLPRKHLFVLVSAPARLDLEMLKSRWNTPQESHPIHAHFVAQHKTISILVHLFEAIAKFPVPFPVTGGNVLGPSVELPLTQCTIAIVIAHLESVGRTQGTSVASGFAPGLQRFGNVTIIGTIVRVEASAIETLILAKWLWALILTEAVEHGLEDGGGTALSLNIVEGQGQNGEEQQVHGQNTEESSSTSRTVQNFTATSSNSSKIESLKSNQNIDIDIFKKTLKIPALTNRILLPTFFAWSNNGKTMKIFVQVSLFQTVFLLDNSEESRGILISSYWILLFPLFHG